MLLTASALWSCLTFSSVTTACDFLASMSNFVALSFIPSASIWHTALDALLCSMSSSSCLRVLDASFKIWNMYEMLALSAFSSFACVWCTLSSTSMQLCRLLSGQFSPSPAKSTTRVRI